MTEKQRTLNEPAADTGLPQGSPWLPKRGDLAYDTATRRTGVVIAIPKDTGADLHHLRPEGGGDDWTAHTRNLAPPPATVPAAKAPRSAASWTRSTAASA